jgi:iron complex outermembrane receptor protein
MAYFTFSQGWRSGGFSARANTVEVLESGQDPEKLDNYELGIKSDWLDRRLRLNATLFHMIYNDMQIESNIPCESCSTGQQTAVLNVGKATIDGVELEFTGNPIENWTLTGSVGLLDAVYDEFFTDLLGTGTPADYSYLPLRRAPETTWALQSNYEIQMPVGDLSWFIGYNWTSDYAATIDDHPGTHVDSFGILNSSLTYQYSDALEFSLYGNNLTDEGAFTHVYAVGGTAEGGSLWKFANPRVPMTYGLKVIYRFGK